jgi:hypothetical protein
VHKLLIPWVPLALSGRVAGRAYYPRDPAEFARLLGALPAARFLALIRLPPQVTAFSIRESGTSRSESGFTCSLCQGAVREGRLGAKVYQWCRCTLLVGKLQHLALFNPDLWSSPRTDPDVSVVARLRSN